jgi:Porin PorA
MRRPIGTILAGLGAFLFAAAVLVRFYVGDQVIKYPLKESLTTTLQGTGFSYFSPSLVREVTGATVRTTSKVTGDPGSGSSSRAVWDEFTAVDDVTRGTAFSYNARRFAFDRRTAELIDCCAASIDGNTGIRQSGLVGFLWPFGTQKKTYAVFDPTLNAPRPARYAGTSVIGGISVYRFVEYVPPTQAGHESLPASLVGMPGTSMVTLPEYYTATNTFWVDPLTGAQLNTTQNQKVTLEDATGAQRLVLLDGTLNFTPQSVRTVVNLDKSGRSEYTLLMTIIPLACGLAGLAGIIAGIVLAKPRRDERPDRADATVPASVLDPAVPPGAPRHATPRGAGPTADSS